MQARAGLPFCGVLDALGPPRLTASVSLFNAMRTSRLIFLAIAVCLFVIGGYLKRSASPSKSSSQAEPSKPLSAPPEVRSASDEGFHDLVFYIQEHKKLADGSQSIRGAGTYKGRVLGLEVILGPTWQEGALGKDIPLVTYRGLVTYRSIGGGSDAFVQVLDELYGTKLSPASMGTETRFTGISLGGDPRDLSKGPVKIKLFFESGSQADYAELFTNIELAGHRLEVGEKDEEYRAAVIKALRAH